MADDVIREPHSVRRATGPLFGEPRLMPSIAVMSPADELLARIDPAKVHLFSDAELATLLRAATLAPRQNRPLVDALRLEAVERIVQRHELTPGDEPA